MLLEAATAVEVVVPIDAAVPQPLIRGRANVMTQTRSDPLNLPKPSKPASLKSVVQKEHFLGLLENKGCRRLERAESSAAVLLEVG